MCILKCYWVEQYHLPFILVEQLSSKVILGNPFLALLYPFSTTDNGICTNILETEVFFKFILPPIPKDKHLLKEISIFKDMGTDELITDNDEITTNPKVNDTTLPSSAYVYTYYLFSKKVYLKLVFRKIFCNLCPSQIFSKSYIPLRNRKTFEKPF